MLSYSVEELPKFNLVSQFVWIITHHRVPDETVYTSCRLRFTGSFIDNIRCVIIGGTYIYSAIEKECICTGFSCIPATAVVIQFTVTWTDDLHTSQ